MDVQTLIAKPRNSVVDFNFSLSLVSVHWRVVERFVNNYVETADKWLKAWNHLNHKAEIGIRIQT